MTLGLLPVCFLWMPWWMTLLEGMVVKRTDFKKYKEIKKYIRLVMVSKTWFHPVCLSTCPLSQFSCLCSLPSHCTIITNSFAKGCSYFLSHLSLKSHTILSCDFINFLYVGRQGRLQYITKVLILQNLRTWLISHTVVERGTCGSGSQFL